MNKIDTPEWKGYTLEEIRFQKMLAMAKAEIGRQFFMERVAELTAENSRPATIIGKLTSALSYFDYAVLAFRLVKSATRVFRRRR